MAEIPLTIETFKAVATVLILLAAIYSFVTEKVSPDLTALMAILALLVTGVLHPSEAFSGFSHPATISVAAVLVLSAGIEHTGALTFLVRRVMVPLGRSEMLFTAAIMLLIGTISAFINNTAAVAVFIPAVLETCRRTGISPGRVLMPMSHAATIGGMCTLIGTSTNLVAHEYARSQGLSGFGMFELGKVGLPMLLAGFFYILFVGRHFLPRNNTANDLPSYDQAGNYLAELLIQASSDWVGKPVRAELLARNYELELLALYRQQMPVELNESTITYAAGDSLRVRGPLEQILKLAARSGLDLHRPANPPTQIGVDDIPLTPKTKAQTGNLPNDTAATQPSRLAEVVVLTPSGLIGQTLKQARFAQLHSTIALALRRRGHLDGRPSTVPLKAGDVLVLEGSDEALVALADTPGFLVIGTRFWPEERPGKILLTLLTLAGVIAAASFNLLPIVTAATAGCVVLMLTRCVRPREAYRAIDLSIVFLLAGSLALGTALEKTGLTTTLAHGLAHLGNIASPFVVMAFFFLTAVLVSEFMSNSGTVPLLAPIALSLAAKLNLNPMALMAAITFGSTAAFAMPIGYQTSLMIYGPGGYRFKDFMRMGLALDAILAVLALLLIPIFWPLVRP